MLARRSEGQQQATGWDSHSEFGNQHRGRIQMSAQAARRWECLASLVSALPVGGNFVKDSWIAAAFPLRSLQVDESSRSWMVICRLCVDKKTLSMASTVCRVRFTNPFVLRRNLVRWEGRLIPLLTLYCLLHFLHLILKLGQPSSVQGGIPEKLSVLLRHLFVVLREHHLHSLDDDRSQNPEQRQSRETQRIDPV